MRYLTIIAVFILLVIQSIAAGEYQLVLENEIPELTFADPVIGADGELIGYVYIIDDGEVWYKNILTQQEIYVTSGMKKTINRFSESNDTLYIYTLDNDLSLITKYSILNDLSISEAGQGVIPPVYSYEYCGDIIFANISFIDNGTEPQVKYSEFEYNVNPGIIPIYYEQDGYL